MKSSLQAGTVCPVSQIKRHTARPAATAKMMSPRMIGMETSKIALSCEMCALKIEYVVRQSFIAGFYPW
jgi:hypothetical protein